MGLGPEYWSFLLPSHPSGICLRPAAGWLAFSRGAGCLLLCVQCVCTWQLLAQECHIESFLFSQLNQRHDWQGWQLPRPCCESALSDHWCKCCFSRGAALCPSIFPTLPHPTFCSAFHAFAPPFTLWTAFPYQLLFLSPCRVPCCRPLSAIWSRRLLIKCQVCPALLLCLPWYVLPAAWAWGTVKQGSSHLWWDWTFWEFQDFVAVSVFVNWGTGADFARGQPPEAAGVMARSLHADPLFFYKLLLPAHWWGRLIAS